MGSWKRDARRHPRGASSDVAWSSSSPDGASFEAVADQLFGPVAGTRAATAPPHPTHDTRAEQLSAQVADALTLALAAARSAVLRDLIVVAVTPRRGAACLEVVLEVGPDHAVGEAAAAVQRALGWLRGEVADAIERKRVPELVAVVVPAARDPEVTS